MTTIGEKGHFYQVIRHFYQMITIGEMGHFYHDNNG